MKYCIALCLFAVMAVALGRPEEKYTDKYDHVDVEEIMKNERLFNSYVKCILDEGKCTAEGTELKSHIKEALENKCGKCTDTQKTETRRVMEYVINNEPTVWNQLIEKYDPTRKYVTLYEDELKKVQSKSR